MLKTIAVIAIVLAVALAGIVAYAATQPDTFRVTRSLGINAAPERIFPLINDLRQMNAWNPFVLSDPKVVGRYSGPATGKGAAYDFEGEKSGVGRIEIEEMAPHRKVTMRLAMLKPFRANNTVELSLDAAGDTTKVTWAMTGGVPLLAKVFCLFTDMDKMVGRSFEDGLANLKAIAER
jgi:hypothetical protein